MTLEEFVDDPEAVTSVVVLLIIAISCAFT